MSKMPQSVYRYIFDRSFGPQIVVIGLTLALLPLAPIPLELQRRLLDDAVANKDLDLLFKLGLFYLAAMFLTAGLKFAMRAQRELISASIVRKLRRSVFLAIYTHAPDHREELDNEVNEGAVVSMMGSEVEKLGGFAGSAISGPLFELGTLVVVLGYMFWVEPLVASIAVALYSPQLVIVPIFQARMNRLAQKKALKRLKIETLSDLLYFFPSRYGHVSQVKTINQADHDDHVTIYGIIRSIGVKKTYQSKIPTSEAIVEDINGDQIKVIWFHQAFIAKTMSAGQNVRLYALDSFLCAANAN